MRRRVGWWLFRLAMWVTPDPGRTPDLVIDADEFEQAKNDSEWAGFCEKADAYVRDSGRWTPGPTPKADE